MRLGDLDHLRSRVASEAGKELVNGDVFAFMIDTEPTIEKDRNEEPIEWIPTKREHRTKNCHSLTSGVECSNCKTFEEYPVRFCKGCGGRFNGELPEFVNKLNKRYRRI